jgi:CheY-like chemotaxis protein
MQRRALVVDDDAAVCEFIRGVLGATGVEVLTLTNSAEAVAHMEREKFAVALFDLRMPSPDGAELTRISRAPGINQMTPIILVSDDQNLSAVSEGFSAGASFFLYKPIDKSRLLHLIGATQGAIEQEKRRFRRVELRSRVQLGFEHQEWEFETVDISLNGMLVAGPGSVPAGTTVRVNLHLAPDMKPIVGLGSVARVLGANQMGIQLNQLTMAESGRLQDFLLPLILQDGQRELHAGVTQIS